MDKLAKEVRSAKTSSIWRHRFLGEIGVVMNLEIGPGTDQRGHPHAHLFIYARTEKALEAFLDWLRARWKKRVRVELIEGAGLTLLGRNPDSWAPRLRYVLKGNRVDPQWPLGLLGEVLESITSHRRLFTTWGIAGRKGGWTRARRNGTIRKFHPVAPSHLRATG
jgi:hypothetical protein